MQYGAFFGIPKQWKIIVILSKDKAIQNDICWHAMWSIHTVTKVKIVIIIDSPPRSLLCFLLYPQTMKYHCDFV